MIATLSPILTLAATSLITLLYGAFTNSARGTAKLTVLSLAAAALPLLEYPTSGALFPVRQGVLLQISPFTNLASLILLLTAIVAVPLMRHVSLNPRHEKPELYILLQLTILGMLVMMAASDLLSFYVGLELMSFPLYILAAFNRDDAKSSEAGLKYFVLGGFASGLTLFGISLFYAGTGTTSFHALSHAIPAALTQPNPILLMALALTLLGAIFKLSIAPFHMWTPDVYEGAPTPVTAIMSALPKIATFVLLMRLSSGAFGSLAHIWQPGLAILAAISMLTGATLAIIQSNLKRLLAFSTVANVGFIMVGVVAATPAGHAGALLYVTIYALTTLGLFASVIAAGCNRVEDLKGLASRNPLLAALMLLMLFSLAGVPPFAGFMAKFAVFSAAVAAGYTNLAVVGVLASVIASFYSLWLIKVMYFETPTVKGTPQIAPGLQLTLAVVGALTVALGILPSLVSTPAFIAAQHLFS